MIKLGIDPGHGGSKPGARGHGIVEKDYVLELCRRLHSTCVILYPDVEFTMTRLLDTHISHRNRAAATNGLDYVLSIHVNASSFEARGLMAFHWPGNEDGRLIADTIQRAAPAWLGNRSKRSSYAAGVNWPRVRYVLKRHRPTAVLVELGFLSNPEDAKALKIASIQDGLISAILCGINTARTLHYGREHV